MLYSREVLLFHRDSIWLTGCALKGMAAYLPSGHSSSWTFYMLTKDVTMQSPLCQLLGFSAYNANTYVQGLHTAKVKSKRALLVEEGVHFSGTRIKASCVLDADELLAAVAQAGV